jgi:hypothetical protein
VPRQTKEEVSNTDWVKDCSLHAATTNATCQRPEIHAATCVTCQSPEIHATTCQRPEIHAATCVTCQSPEIHATTCQRPEIHAATCVTCQSPEIHATTCQRPETRASSQFRRNKRSRRFRGHLQALSYPPTGMLDTVGTGGETDLMRWMGSWGRATTRGTNSSLLDIEAANTLPGATQSPWHPQPYKEEHKRGSAGDQGVTAGASPSGSEDQDMNPRGGQPHPSAPRTPEGLGRGPRGHRRSQPVGVRRERHEPQGGQPHPSAPRTTHLWLSGLKGKGKRGRGRDLTSCGHMALVATKWWYPAGTVW